MKSIVLFWAERGVRIFRVDNPHTKPVAFWDYLVKGVRDKYPDTIFLSEAFTRPKMMKALAKAGFNQSYTYFTWRNSKRELIEYFTELTQTEMSEYFRPNLWPNTPDILPFVLQEGGRPAFMIRVLLAATLSPFYGKMTAARDNIILVVVNLDPFRKQHSFVDVPIEQFGQMESEEYRVQDLLSGAMYTWRGRRNYVELDPEIQPAHIFLVRR